MCTRARVVSDPALLESILRNLLSNAVKSTRQGGILIGARRRGERLRLEVHDSGPGIAAEAQAATERPFLTKPVEAGILAAALAELLARA